jgi:hypothetical protein
MIWMLIQYTLIIFSETGSALIIIAPQIEWWLDFGNNILEKVYQNISLRPKPHFRGLESRVRRVPLWLVDVWDMEKFCLITSPRMPATLTRHILWNREGIRWLYSSLADDSRIHTPGRVFKSAGYIGAINQRTDSFQDQIEETEWERSTGLEGIAARMEEEWRTATPEFRSEIGALNRYKSQCSKGRPCLLLYIGFKAETCERFSSCYLQILVWETKFHISEKRSCTRTNVLKWRQHQA